jgi:hypothetical protein
MSIKTDRPQVRTAEELERKYNFAGMEKNIKQSDVGLTKVSNELYNFVRAVAGDTSILERQLDGEIDTWYGDDTPTLLNEPASNWDVSEYSEHIDDLYYDRNSGMTYQFTENNGTYSWEVTNNNFLAEVLALANNAKDTADNKKTIFVESQPVPPYDNGDLWLNNKKLYVCQLAREKDDTFHEQDFVIATDYVDGTQATANANAIQIMSGQITQLLADSNEYRLNFITTRTLTDGFTESLQEIANYIRFVDGDIILGKGDNLYTLRIENDRINIYYNGQPISNWIQDKFSVTQLNLGNFAFIPRQNGFLSFRKVK